MPGNDDRPRVFISYAHADKKTWLAQLMPYLNALELNEHIDLWYDGHIDLGNDWYADIINQMESARVAVLLVSQHLLASRFCKLEEIPALLQPHRRGELFIFPVLCTSCLWEDEPWLSRIQMLQGADGPLQACSEAEQSTVLTDLARKVRDAVDGNYKPPEKPMPDLPPESFDITRLPQTGPLLFGRQPQLRKLDTAWKGDGINLVAFRAGAGTGKSALVRVWAEMMAEHSYRGAERVLAWSFYSQGAGQDVAGGDTRRFVSSDPFIAFALKFFGDEAMANSAASPWDKARRLAELINQRRTLLLLDGVEPLQCADKQADHGALRDPAMQTLLRHLSLKNKGLCVVTTREPLTDLDGSRFKDKVIREDLDQLTVDSGRALLRVARVRGDDTELQAAVKELNCNALAVTLLGVLLGETPTHHIGGVRDLPAAFGDDAAGGQARRVIQALAERLGRGPEQDLLHLLGLLDRPLTAESFAALMEPPGIPELTESLSEQTDQQRQATLTRLRELRLLSRESKHAPGELDAHPAVRDHFADHLQQEHLEAWKEGHRRLYQHLADSAEHQPDTLAGLQPLYQAVAHGCQAGLHEEACANIYRDRILRGGQEAFSTFVLGAIGADLGAVACFFLRQWDRLASELSKEDQGWLLGQAAFRLRALGRLTEALEPMRAGVDMRVARENWKNAAISASNLSQLELTLGDLDAAILDGEQGVGFADRSEYDFWRMVCRISLADALHQAGDQDRAGSLFQEAEAMQEQRQTEYPLLYSLQGFWYCDLLLAQAERAAWATFGENSGVQENGDRGQTCVEVTERASRTLEWAAKHNLSLLTIAMDHLTLGRASLYRTLLETDAETRPDAAALANARQHITQAVDGLRRAGTTHHLPRGLLTRSWLRVVEGNNAGARADLDEAWELAERGPMPLFQADIHLHCACLFKDRDALAQARSLIEKHGYWRRREELEDAETWLLQR